MNDILRSRVQVNQCVNLLLPGQVVALIALLAEMAANTRVYRDEKPPQKTGKALENNWHEGVYEHRMD